MRIFLLSDLHLEGNNYKHPLPDADVVVLAGDIFVARHMNRSSVVRKFFTKLSETYKHIIYIPGNHEYYEGYIDAVDAHIEHAFSEWGITVHQLNRLGYVVIDDVAFVGNTLWTDYDNGDPVQMQIAFQCMSDFQLIFKRKTNTQFMPADAYELHLKNRLQIMTALQMLPEDMPKVVVTHHCPIREMIHPKYEVSVLNWSFASDMALFFEQKCMTNVKYWFCGHTHEKLTHVMNGVTVMTNPRGYPGEHQDGPFDPNCVVEV